MARKHLSTPTNRSAESRSWRSQPSLPEPSAASQLDQARDIFAVLAKAQKGLACDSQPGSVTISYEGAPGAEAAILEAAERFAAKGALVLQRGLMWVRLRLAQKNEIADADLTSARVDASAR